MFQHQYLTPTGKWLAFKLERFVRQVFFLERWFVPRAEHNRVVAGWRIRNHALENEVEAMNRFIEKLDEEIQENSKSLLTMASSYAGEWAEEAEATMETRQMSRMPVLQVKIPEMYESREVWDFSKRGGEGQLINTAHIATREIHQTFCDRLYEPLARSIHKLVLGHEEYVDVDPKYLPDGRWCRRCRDHTHRLR